MPEELPFTFYTSNLETLKWGKTTFGPGLSKFVPPKHCIDNKKAAIMTTRLVTAGLRIETLFKVHITMLCYHTDGNAHFLFVSLFPFSFP